MKGNQGLAAFHHKAPNLCADASPRWHPHTHQNAAQSLLRSKAQSPHAKCLQLQFLSARWTGTMTVRCAKDISKWNPNQLHSNGKSKQCDQTDRTGWSHPLIGSMGSELHVEIGTWVQQLATSANTHNASETTCCNNSQKMDSIDTIGNILTAFGHKGTSHKWMLARHPGCHSTATWIDLQNARHNDWPILTSYCQKHNQTYVYDMTLHNRLIGIYVCSVSVAPTLFWDMTS